MCQFVSVTELQLIISVTKNRLKIKNTSNCSWTKSYVEAKLTLAPL